ncbi:MAG: Ni/Fe-hydrogenase, b-type cytochrome subunit [Deltaproteobacteria bacterium]|nr:Ni/Fe-hydrogenase, b-type cytochrome subunit [Deltaproteobacteria bacterium]
MEREYIYTWSRTDRIVHWTITLAVAVLTLTGFYIHWPFIEGGAPGGVEVMAWMRFAHFTGAYALILGLIVRVYLAFASRFDADWRDFSLWRNLRSVPDILGYYLFLKRGHKEYRRYNPLQALTYLFWLFLILFLSLTGFALYRGRIFGILSTPDSFRWVNDLLGGESYTRIWHYLAMWVFLITVAVHVYMAAMTSWANRDHTFRSIFTGYKVKPRRA